MNEEEMLVRAFPEGARIDKRTVHSDGQISLKIHPGIKGHGNYDYKNEKFSNAVLKFYMDYFYSEIDERKHSMDLIDELYDALRGYRFSFSLSGTKRSLKVYFRSISRFDRCYDLDISSIDSGYFIRGKEQELLFATKDWMDIINFCVSEIRGEK